MENGPFIDGLPINSMVIFHGYVSHNQMVPKKEVFTQVGLRSCQQNASCWWDLTWFIHHGGEAMGTGAPVRGTF